MDYITLGKNVRKYRLILGFTQEELADKMDISRQTISKWELGAILPEIEKLVDLCEIFNCSVDQLLRENMDYSNKAYSDIRIITVEPFRYISYAVISCEPEEDAISHVEGWAKHLKIENPYVIGWDFPQVSQEQRNVFHMRGYGAALILDSERNPSDLDVEIVSQSKQNYITITLEEVSDEGEFAIIPNAYKALMTYMAINGIKEKHDSAILSCYEHEYFDNRGVKFMDIYIAIK